MRLTTVTLGTRFILFRENLISLKNKYSNSAEKNHHIAAHCISLWLIILVIA